MIYKDDMNAEKFEAFLKEVCEELEKKYGKKVAIVMDNASYHTVMVSMKKWTNIFHVQKFSLVCCLSSEMMFQDADGLWVDTKNFAEKRVLLWSPHMERKLESLLSRII